MIFSEYSQSKCKIPKLHVLRYHVTPSIRLYGSVNGMSTETYETLHKSNVKNPYRMTNKKQYILQMLKMVCFNLFCIIFHFIVINFYHILRVIMIGTTTVFGEKTKISENEKIKWVSKFFVGI